MEKARQYSALKHADEERAFMFMLDKIKKIPGGLILIPMLCTAVANTVGSVTGFDFLDFYKVSNPFSQIFKGGSGTGVMTMIGVLLFQAGTQLEIRQLPATVSRGGLFVALRIVIGLAAGFICVNLLGPGLSSSFSGVSAMAFIITLCTCNPAIYAALTDQYGDSVDRSAIGIINIIAVPQFSLIIIMTFYSIEAQNMEALVFKIALSTLLPFLIGCALANTDRAVAEMFAPVSPVIMVILGFCFGGSINLITAVKAGLGGILLAALFLICSVPIFFVADKTLLRRPGYAGVAFASMGGVSISAPGVIATVYPEIAEIEGIVSAASGQIALAFVLVAAICPILTRKVVEKYGCFKQ
jgi:2-keto-3-deoxygluconate permease